MILHEQLHTAGEFTTEAESLAAFDRLVGRHPDLFSSFPEVRGWYTQPRLNTVERTPRIDRILVPRARLVEAGWTHGPIGVEAKSSGRKAGPAIAQILDYGRAVFLIESGCWPRIMLEWIFLWPAVKAGGDLASIMTQHRIGLVHAAHDGSLIFTTDSTTAIKVAPNGAVTARELAAGRKAGTR